MSTPSMAICLAAYEAPPALWKAQLASLRAQTYQDWVCLVQDDASTPRAYKRLAASLKGDRRFVLRRNPRRLGYYHNFEAALRRVPRAARFAAFCDQDDRWYPGKLAASVGLLESSGALLVHSNMRIVDPQGRVLAPGNWVAGANSKVDLETLCLANFVTGAGTVFRRSLLEKALPFPKGMGQLHHDHWMALLALSQGCMAYLDEPQWDYVQHGANAIGHGAPYAPPPFFGRVGGVWARWSSRQHHGIHLAHARALLEAFMPRAAFFAEEIIGRLDGRLAPGAAQQLGLVRSAATSARAMAWLWLRGVVKRRDVFSIEPRLLEARMRVRMDELGWGQR